MKLQRLGALLLAASWPALAAAQSHPAEAAAPASAGAVSWGGQVGFTYANTNFNQGFPPPPAPVATAWQPGWVVGLWARVALPHRFGLQQEYSLLQLGGAVAGGPRYTLRYLSLPLLLRYGLLPRLTVLAGPQFDLLVAARQNGTDITHDTEERGVGATAGLELALGARLALRARYLQGLNHVGIGQRAAGVQEFKWQAVQAGVAVRL